jgi:hypothetical protein
MSMILVLESVPSDADAERIEQDEQATIPFPSRVRWGFGSLDDEDEGAGYSENSISLEKAWHGLHYLLTGDPWDGDGPRAFLLCGGSEEGEDLGYGPARLIDAEEVREIAQVIGGITVDELWSRFDAEQMEQLEVYPGIWDEPEADLREEYGEYFEQLKEFLAQTAEAGHALRLEMT